MGRKIFEKAGQVGAVAMPPATSAEHSATTLPPKPKTAPGVMFGFLTAQSRAIDEAAGLRDQVRALEESAPLRKLDPALIQPSKWANRHEASFATPEFQALKDEILAAGGNVQPIKVRPLPVLNGSTPGSGQEYELIYGHRRHRACAELGLPVLTTIEEISDRSLFEQMERENRGRENLSAWEQGMMYRRALDSGLYPSMRALGEAIGTDVSLISKSVALARLPEVVVQAFASPLDIQFRWAQPLTEAVQKDPEKALARAREIAASRHPLSPTAVLAKLTGAPDPAPPGTRSARIAISSAGKQVAHLTTDSNGRTVVRFEAGALPDSKRDALVKAIEALIAD
jgi:ParB family chromosome partitioning protein